MIFAMLMNILDSALIASLMILCAEMECVTSMNHQTLAPMTVSVAHVEMEFVKIMNNEDSVKRTAFPMPTAETEFAI